LVRPTIKEVARQANVGVGTVSRFITGNGYVKAETGEKIRAAIEDLGFSPNYFASGLRGAASKTVGVMVPDIGNPLFARIIQKLELGLRQGGVSIMLASPAGDPAREVEIVSTLAARGVDGFVLAPTAEDNPALERLIKKLGVPTVFLDRSFMLGAPGVGHVLTSNTEGFEAALCDLLHRNHRDFLMFVVENSRPGLDRKTAFTQMLARADIPDITTRIVTSAQNDDFAYTEILRLHALGQLPDVIISGHNQILPSILTALRQINVAVGQDISLLTFDRIDLGEFHSPQIASVWRDLGLIGQAAFDMLGTLQGSLDPSPPIMISTVYNATPSVRDLRVPCDRPLDPDIAR
jgi:LacI family transcriptional regulator